MSNECVFALGPIWWRDQHITAKSVIVVVFSKMSYLSVTRLFVWFCYFTVRLLIWMPYRNGMFSMGSLGQRVPSYYTSHGELIPTKSKTTNTCAYEHIRFNDARIITLTYSHSTTNSINIQSKLFTQRGNRKHATKNIKWINNTRPIRNQTTNILFFCCSSAPAFEMCIERKQSSKHKTELGRKR